MNKPTEAEIMVALEQLEPAARNRIHAWLADRWPLGMSAAPAKTTWMRDSLPSEETAADASRALDIAEAAAGLPLGDQPPQRDLNKPPDSAPGWMRGANGCWERWVDCSLEDCQHTPVSVLHGGGVQICTNCHGVRVAEEVVESSDDNHTVYAVRGIPVTGAMPFERLTTASEYRTGVFEGPHDQTEHERQAREAAPPEQIREPLHPWSGQRGDVDGRELGQTMPAHDTRLGAFGGPEGIFSVAGDDAAVAGLEEPGLVDNMATMRSQARLTHLLDLLPTWTMLLTHEKYKSPHSALCMLEEDPTIASQWVRAVDREQLVSLLGTTPLAAVRAAELSQPDERRDEWRRIVEPRWACDGLTLLWRAACHVVYVDSDGCAAADKRLRDEASRLLSDLCGQSRCREALAAYAVAGACVRLELLKLFAATTGGSSRQLHRLLGTLILARTRARLLPESGWLDGFRWPDWLDQLESARATANIAKAVQAILDDGSQEAILAIQPDDVVAVLKEETPASFGAPPPGASPRDRTSPPVMRAGFYSHDWTAGFATPVLLNRHCYPWWIGTVQAALRATLVTRANGTAAALPVPDVQRGPYR